ncbi:hypothetical protein ACJJTC_008260 [Scirpophaga incertulas]
MKVLILYMCLLLSFNVAEKLLSLSEVETLFTKLMLKKLTEEENILLADTIQLLHRPVTVSTKTVDNTSELRATIDCILCRSVFTALFQTVKEGQSDTEISETIISLCVNLGIESYNVCTGAVSLNIPVITYIIRNTPEASPSGFCQLILQNAHNPNSCPYQDPRFEWKVQLPEKRDNIPVVNAGQTFKVAIITDAHIDPLYEPFGVADCSEPTCCRKGQSHAKSITYKSTVDESHFEDILVEKDDLIMLDLGKANKIRELQRKLRSRYPTRQSEPAGYWGDYRNCDTPIHAFDDAIDTIKENHDDIDLIYYIGDTIDHGIWETSYELINDMNRYMIDKVRGTFGDDITVVTAIGNHEAQPTNQFAPSKIIEPKLNTTWLYKSLAEKWDHYLTEEAKQTLLERGEFSILARPGLRVISLNNNVAYKMNWWLIYDPLDAKRHLDWLVNELYKAETRGEKVHILAHIPPGVHDLTYTWTREYNRIVQRFSATIAAEFNGHTHSDEFKIFYSHDDTPINVAWGGGSVTTYTFYNLNYKIATIDGKSLMPDNIFNYVYNLTEANLTPNRRPQWYLLYDIKNSFEISDLTATTMNNLVYKMARSQRRLLDLYIAFYSKLSDRRWADCGDSCKIDNLCKTVVTVLWERQKCNELRDMFFSMK